MFNMSKKAFWVPYNEGDIYPTVVKAHQAISKYCDENGDSYTFTGDDEVVITELSAEKSEFVGALLYISLWHIQRSPGTVKTVPYSLFYIAVQTYK